MDIISVRQEDILKNIIGEYIEFAQPVSSQLIRKKYHLNICPATIRIEMQRLSDMDYLYQPHTSAGRIPTDKGYRFIVDDLLKQKISEIDVPKLKKIVAAREKGIFKWVSQLTRLIADVSSAFALSCLPNRGLFFKQGWEWISKEPESGNKDFFFNFSAFLENVEENIDTLDIDSNTKIYIGAESSYETAKDFAIIISECRFTKKEKGFISILGPKRMFYERNIKLVKSLARTLEDI